MKENKRPYNKLDPEMAAIAKEIRFDIKDVPFGVGRCVYKLFYGDRYLIWKGENLIESLSMLQKGFAYHVATGQTEVDDQNNKYHIRFYRYLQSHPSLQFRLEILLIHQNAYQVLKREQLELDKCFSDKKCLNNLPTIYIPKFRSQTNTYGSWITKRNAADLKKFITKTS